MGHYRRKAWVSVATYVNWKKSHGRLRKIVIGICLEWGVSIQKACGTVRFDTSTYHDKSRRTDEAVVEGRIRKIADAWEKSEDRRRHDNGDQPHGAIG